MSISIPELQRAITDNGKTMPRELLHTCGMNTDISFLSGGYRVLIDEPLFFEVIAKTQDNLIVKIVPHERVANAVCQCCQRKGQPNLYHFLPDAVLIAPLSMEVIKQ